MKKKTLTYLSHILTTFIYIDYLVTIFSPKEYDSPSPQNFVSMAQILESNVIVYSEWKLRI